MSNKMDGLTQDQKLFVWDIQENRGEIKNKDKYYPILADIHDNSIDEFKEELTKSKRIGIGLVNEIVSTLDIDEQKIMIECMNQMPKVTATKVRMDLANILAQR